MTLLEAAASALIVVSAALAWAWCITYHITTRGHWRDTEFGWSLMSFCGVIGAVLTLSTIRLAAHLADLHDPVWFQVLRVAVFVGVPVNILWRFRLLLRAQRQENPS